MKLENWSFRMFGRLVRLLSWNFIGKLLDLLEFCSISVSIVKVASLRFSNVYGVSCV